MSWYLNPDGTWPTDDAGKRMFVSEAQFKGCCCNMCQWRRRFEWDCEEEEWVELDYGEDVETDGEWIPAEHEPGESETLCTRTVWGEIVNCLVDPKPEPPPPPEPLTEEEIEECCGPPAPCSCPCSPWPPAEWPCGGLLQQYSLSKMEAEIKMYPMDSGCAGTPDSWRQVRSKSAVTLTATSTSCTWTGSGAFERRNYNFETNEWGEWIDESLTFCRVELVSSLCRWDVSVIGFGVPKLRGLTPAGKYKGRQSDCGGVPPGTIDVDIVIS
jgi:hypothetical protein